MQDVTSSQLETCPETHPSPCMEVGCRPIRFDPPGRLSGRAHPSPGYRLARADSIRGLHGNPSPASPDAHVFPISPENHFSREQDLSPPNSAESQSSSDEGGPFCKRFACFPSSIASVLVAADPPSVLLVADAPVTPSAIAHSLSPAPPVSIAPTGE